MYGNSQHIRLIKCQVYVQYLEPTTQSEDRQIYHLFVLTCCGTIFGSQ